MNLLPLTVTAKVPANIAFLKYWGKSDADTQIPANDSISMTLKNCYTETQASIAVDEPIDRFQLNGRELDLRSPSSQKISKHLANLRQQLVMVDTPPLDLVSVNHFPTGCGIASSASGLGALTLAAAAAWTRSSTMAELAQHVLHTQQLAHLARLGSGSAGRSFWGGFVHWEKVDDACCLSPLHDAAHWALADIVVVISEDPKVVTSTAGHASAWTSPLFPARLAGMHSKVQALKYLLKEKNLAAFGALIEQEALEMHAVMMSSRPAAYYLTKPASDMLGWIREQRHAGNLPAYFTIDAGTNIHLICEQRQASKVMAFLQQAFPEYKLIYDEVGEGPELTATTQPIFAREGQSLAAPN